jgi:HlyD family secretion protein
MKIPKAVSITVFVLMLGTCGAQIVVAATAPPVTVPLPKDAEKSDRKAVSRTGGVDTMAQLPEVGGRVGGNGVVEPARRESRVAAQVSAVVSTVNVKEGDWVKQGELLVQLANDFELAAVAVAEADLAAERANLARTFKGLRVEDREAVAAESQVARSRSELSVGVLARIELLAKSGAVSVDELDRARRQAQAKATDARLRAAEAGSRTEDTTFARARVQASEARVAQAKATLERLAVRASVEGEVLQVKVRPGELYNVQGSAEPLLILGDTRTLRVRMDVDERDIARVKPNAAAWVTADAFGSRRFPGKVVEIGRRFGRKNIRTDDPIEKNDTKILEVVIELEGKELLIPGQRVMSYITEQ